MMYSVVDTTTGPHVHFDRGPLAHLPVAHHSPIVAGIRRCTEERCSKLSTLLGTRRFATLVFCIFTPDEGLEWSEFFGVLRNLVGFRIRQ